MKILLHSFLTCVKTVILIYFISVAKVFQECGFGKKYRQTLKNFQPTTNFKSIIGIITKGDFRAFRSISTSFFD